VSAVAREPAGASLSRLWRDPAAWATTVDVFAILIVVTLPWSTSLVAMAGMQVQDELSAAVQRPSRDMFHYRSAK